MGADQAERESGPSVILPPLAAIHFIPVRDSCPPATPATGRDDAALNHRSHDRDIRGARALLMRMPARQPVDYEPSGGQEYRHEELQANLGADRAPRCRLRAQGGLWRWRVCSHGASKPPNGSRLSCGRSARWRKRSGRTSRARQGTTQQLPLERAPTASFKRLLGSRPLSAGVTIAVLHVGERPSTLREAELRVQRRRIAR